MHWTYSYSGKEIVNTEDDEEEKASGLMPRHKGGKRKQDTSRSDPSDSDRNADSSNDNEDDDDDKPAPKKPKLEVCKRCAIRGEACMPALKASSVCTRCKKAKVACSLSGKVKKGGLEASRNTGDLPSELGSINRQLGQVKRQLKEVSRTLHQVLLCLSAADSASLKLNIPIFIA
ncbi:hypothetical protein BT96DRAFT_1005113 [Gymnopus androsaceus JB14]|uniref:Uncharacterized protein n=1 Tax=Gymnopus androsaceus JB14 TaxID=1447944 RepID=A0A6A4GPB5_9AGAR|nr:hypothetical protein BT96DRAFT_1005113 [Gymnopus androsaceus JB14]